MNRPSDNSPTSPARPGAVDTGLDDPRILELVALAVELEAFEAESVPTLRLHSSHAVQASHAVQGRSPGRRVWLRNHPRRSVGLLLGLAAVVTIAGLSLPRLFSLPQGPVPLPVARMSTSATDLAPATAVVPAASIPNHAEAAVTETARSIPELAHAPAASEYIVLAIYQDSEGEIGCMQWERRTLAHGQSLSDLRPGELLGLSANVTCPARPDRLVVAGITGAADALPSSDGAAEHLALCIARSPDQCPSDVNSFDSRSLTCLPHGLTAVVESVAMTRR